MAVVSGYPCPLYRELYAGWPVVTRRARTNGARAATEALWLSPAPPRGSAPASCRSWRRNAHDRARPRRRPCSGSCCPASSRGAGPAGCGAACATRAAYARARDAWSLLVAQAVRDARWRPPPAARYRVAVAVRGGGKRDLDRVCTAVLDALQAGGAVRDDCLVDALVADRSPAGRRRVPRTVVEVSICGGGRPGAERRLQ